MEDVKYVMLTIGYVIGEERYNHISKELLLNYKYENVDRQILKENNKVLTKNQKIVLFSYLYLYYILLEEKENEIKFTELLDILALPKSLVKNCKETISDECVKYIKSNIEDETQIVKTLFEKGNEHISNIITYIVEMPLADDKNILLGLNPKVYEHSMDKVALEKLKLNPVLEKVLKIFADYDFERLIKIQYTGSLLKVTNKNLPYIYNAFEEACKILDIKKIPPLYLEQGFINAHTRGINEPIVVISNAALSLLTYDELLFIIGHELGHIKSQHFLYHSIGSYLPYIGNIVGNITFGIGDIISSGLELALYNWQRMSEFTADRAGLLVCQNIDSAISVMSKIAGYPTKYYATMNNEDFLEQAKCFEDLDSSKYNKILKILSAAYNTHPWTVLRAKELKKWMDTGDYTKILQQGHVTRSMKICQKCGASLNSIAKFCNMCGEQLDK